MRRNGDNRVVRSDAWPASPPTKPDADANGEPALEKIPTYVAELREYVGHYMTASTDAVKFKVRRLAVGILMGAAALIAGAVVVLAAVAFLLMGLAGGLAQWTGGIWTAQLILGATLLILLAGGFYTALKLRREKLRRKTLAKYERRRKNQFARFGHDAGQRAAARSSG